MEDLLFRVTSKLLQKKKFSVAEKSVNFLNDIKTTLSENH
jgi:hypothetical protein